MCHTDLVVKRLVSPATARKFTLLNSSGARADGTCGESKPLHPVRALVTGVLAQLSAVLMLDLAQQPEQIGPAPTAAPPCRTGRRSAKTCPRNPPATRADQLR